MYILPTPTYYYAQISLIFTNKTWQDNILHSPMIPLVVTTKGFHLKV